MPRVHAFSDDALADHDAVALAELVRRRETTPDELAAAALARAGRIAELGAVVSTGPTATGASDARLAGVPTLAKDNVEVAGMPCGHGTAAFTPHPAAAHGPVTRQLLATGLSVLGTSRMPEFGFNASTEFEDAPPARNPWGPELSPGASSGGAAVLVAAGVVPVAHANDGGGSIRIPAACCGLVGLKPGRGRLVPNPQGARLPIDLIADGVVSRTVRDSAAFLAAAERYRRNPALPPVGLVQGPAERRLRIGLVLDSPTGAPPARRPGPPCSTPRGRWRSSATTSSRPRSRYRARSSRTSWTTGGCSRSSPRSPGAGCTGATSTRPGWTASRSACGSATAARSPAPRRSCAGCAGQDGYARVFTRHDLVLSPVTAHPAPRLGHLSPTVPYDELLRRLLAYVAFTPLNNVAGSPGIAVPGGLSAEGVPIGVHLSAAAGDERSLLETAFALEAERPFPRIY